MPKACFPGNGVGKKLNDVKIVHSNTEEKLKKKHISSS